MNKVFLAEALKQQIMLWHSMNQQFMFSAKADKLKIIRIVGRDAIEFFTRQGLGDIRPTQQDALNAAQAMSMGQQPPQVPPGPQYAVNVGQTDTGAPLEVPKYMPDPSGGGGNLIIEPGDLEGNYDYVPDIESMAAPSSEDVEAKLMSLLTTMVNPVIIQGLASEGQRPKYKELLVKMIEATNVVKDADAYFEDISNAQPPQPGAIGGVPNQGQAQQGGVPQTAGGVPPQGNVPNGGVAGSPVANPAIANQVGGGGPPQIPV